MTSKLELDPYLFSHGTLRKYPRNVQKVADFINSKYENSKIAIYGDGEHTAELIPLLESEIKLVCIIKQRTVVNGYQRQIFDLATIYEDEIKDFDFDYLLILGQWSDKAQNELLHRLKITQDRLINPYSEAKLRQDIIGSFYKNNNIKTTDKPSLVLFTVGDIKDIISIAAKTLSKYFDITKVYINNSSAVRKTNPYIKQTINLDGSLEYLEYLMANFIPDIIVYNLGSSLDPTIGTYIKRLSNAKTKFVIDTTDMIYLDIFNCHDSECAEAFDIEYERFKLNKKHSIELFKSNDLIITNFTDLYEIEIKKLYCKNHLFTYSYIDADLMCFDENANYNSSNIKLCYSGGFDFTKSHPIRAYRCLDLIFETIASQNIDISIFSYFQNIENTIYSNLLNSQNIQWRGFHDPDTLPSIFSKFDFGIMIFDFNTGVEPYLKKVVKSQFTVKILNYISAGIPIITNKENILIAELIEKHGIGISISMDDIANLSSIIASLDYKQLKQNIKIFQEFYKKSNFHEEIATRIQNLL